MLNVNAMELGYCKNLISTGKQLTIFMLYKPYILLMSTLPGVGYLSLESLFLNMTAFSVSTIQL